VDEAGAARRHGHGVIIEGKRILTNAHVVVYASQVQVQANQSGDKSPPPSRPSASASTSPCSSSTTRRSSTPARPCPAPRLPAVKDSVLVYGFPTGGTNLSITKGIVSRIDFTTYNFPGSGLRIQIDAAINPATAAAPPWSTTG
jgi:S1-C subfamily serine protease